MVEVLTAILTVGARRALARTPWPGGVRAAVILIA
jgi:hypothetical protein